MLVILDFDGVLRVKNAETVFSAYCAGLKAVGVGEDKISALDAVKLNAIRLLPNFFNSSRQFFKFLLRLCEGKPREISAKLERLSQEALKGECREALEMSFGDKKGDNSTEFDFLAQCAHAAYSDFQYSKEGQLQMPPVEGSLDAVRRLLDKGFKVSIVTGSPSNSVRSWFKVHAAKDLLEAIGVIGCEDVEEQKPSPQGFLKAMKESGEREIIGVGDHALDVKAARNAALASPENSIKAASLLSGAGSEKGLSEAKPDFVFTNLMEFTEWLVRK